MKADLAYPFRSLHAGWHIRSGLVVGSGEQRVGGALLGTLAAIGIVVMAELFASCGIVVTAAFSSYGIGIMVMATFIVCGGVFEAKFKYNVGAEEVASRDVNRFH